MEQTLTHESPALDKDHGYYAAISVTNPRQEVEDFCKSSANVEKVLSDLPGKVTNFLNLELDSVSAGRIVYRNRNKIAPGTLSFIVQENQFHPGAVISVDAKLEKIHFREEGPSTLMNLFLKRMKNLIETGEIPTTKGQPSGREELKH